MPESKEVIDRLRASRQKTEDAKKSEGEAFGRIWARGKAEADELERLKAYRDSIRPDEWDDQFGIPANDPRFGIAPYVFFVETVTDDDSTGRAEAARWWGEAMTGADYKNSRYVQGFIEGALEVWEAAEPQL